MSKKFETLKKRIIEFDSKKEKLRLKHKAEEMKLLEKYWEDKKQIKEICTHPSEFVKYEDHYNYHNGDDDSGHFCQLCNKRVQEKTSVKYE